MTKNLVSKIFVTFDRLERGLTAITTLARKKDAIISNFRGPIAIRNAFLTIGKLNFNNLKFIVI